MVSINNFTFFCFLFYSFLLFALLLFPSFCFLWIYIFFYLLNRYQLNFVFLFLIKYTEGYKSPSNYCFSWIPQVWLCKTFIVIYY